jgi:hypothetical protein
VSTDPAANVVIPLSPSERRRVKRPMPGWASVAVLSACFVLGGWLLWWFVAGSGPSERTVTLSEVPRQARRRSSDGGAGLGTVFQQIARTTFGVMVVKPGEWRVRAAGDAVMRVVKQPAGTFDYTFFYDRNDLVTAPELALLVYRAEMVNNADAARAADITPQQMATFKALQSQTGMVISAGERAEMTAMWEKYSLADAASKSALEKPMVARLQTIGKDNLAATKQQMSRRAALVKATLTAEQLKRVR